MRRISGGRSLIAVSFPILFDNPVSGRNIRIKKVWPIANIRRALRAFPHLGALVVKSHRQIAELSSGELTLVTALRLHCLDQQNEFGVGSHHEGKDSTVYYTIAFTAITIQGLSE